MAPAAAARTKCPTAPACRQRQDMQALLKRRAGSGCANEEDIMRFQCRHRGRLPSAAAKMAVFLIAMSLQSHCNGYAPSTSFSRRCSRGLPPTQSRVLALRHAPSLQKCHWEKYVDGRHTLLFSTVSDNESVNQEDATLIDQETNSEIVDSEAVFDNLLPSTMATATNGGMAIRRATGLSSSVLLPLSESDQHAPLFQSNIIPSEYNAPEKATSWKERLVDVSNLASLLCVLDCTLLPLMSVAIPALSWGVGIMTGAGAASTAATTSGPLSALLAYLPALSHGIAIYFVIPVGLLTTFVNYFFGHREARFSLASILGVALIYMANSSTGVGIPSVDAWLQSVGIAAAHGGGHHAGHVHDACGAVVGAATGMMAHTCPEGVAHRLTNTLGCALLLGSNYYSKKYMEERSQGCAASALAEAWGGDGAGRAVCPPGCNCEQPSYGTGASSSSRMGGETFFEWDRTAGRGGKGRSFGGSRFRR